MMKMSDDDVSPMQNKQGFDIVKIIFTIFNFHYRTITLKKAQSARLAF